ncbi:Putative kinase (plasmid) [Sodalis praecaptivus]|uniref:Putative kinase n=1 Tax=Sodalis praecaptivus TaxID=1239307 RepID=W0I469_9GAMM|nr:ATPase AAA [Sodalis praecaptivus]AHF79213.1 Putative kinase [Sodalis praecaptivus]
MKKLILVNGVPASGKSAVARTIADYFNFPVLSIDEIKEPFMVQFSDIIDRPLNRKLGYAAYEAMFNIVKSAPDNTVFVMDAWFGFREKSVLQDYLAISHCQAVFEIWNKVSSTLVAQRYKQRCSCRVKGHPGEEYIPELIALAEKAQPMGVGDVYTLDHDRGAENDDLIMWIKNRLHHS